MKRGVNMELWDLYDGNGCFLGQTIQRGMPHPAGTYHLVVNVWVTNSRGELLLTLRAPEKEQYPDLWENQGGSALAGEDSLSAVRRELYEETGIHLVTSDFTLLGTSLEKTAIVDIYAVRTEIPIKDVHLQLGETVSAQWVTPHLLEVMVAAGQVSDATVRRRKAVLSQWEDYLNCR